MKKVITMVGTSIFENYIEKEKNTDLPEYIKELKGKRSDEYKEEKDRIIHIKNEINKWIEKNPTQVLEICAEVKSIKKIFEEVKDNLAIYFLTSDTILSNVSFELIKDNWEKFDGIKDFKFYPSEFSEAVIKGLQVQNRKEFSEGMVNLINRVFSIANGCWADVIINITAGYKATIPYLTILAQVNRCPIYYIFEETDALIKIPYIPIDINWNVFKKNENFLFDLEVKDIKEISSQSEPSRDLEALIEKVDDLICLNPLGIILWEKFKNSFYLFMISKPVEEYLKRNTQRKRVVEKSFVELVKRVKENPSHPDLDHKIVGIEIPQGFKVFKHKEENLQVRILYRKESYTTKYHSQSFRIYIGLIAIGQEVHNAESEYIQNIKNNSSKITNLNDYSVYRIEKEINKKEF